MKTCTKCQKEHPIENFHRHKGFIDGRRSTCKDCANVYQKKYYSQNREEHIEKCMNWHKENREAYNKIQERYRNKKKRFLTNWKLDGKLRVSAQKTLNFAVLKGEVTKSECCQICGIKSEDLEAHHYDYTTPLKVTWLCEPCFTCLERRKHASKVREQVIA